MTYIEHSIPSIPLEQVLRRYTADPEDTHVYDCDHSQRELRLRTLKDGRRSWQRQCVTCGEGSSSISATAVPEHVLQSPPAFDDTLRERFYAERKDAYEQRKAEKEAEWWAMYGEYLSSPEWFDLREKVYARAKNRCEGCGEKLEGDYQVHHLTYTNVCHEFMFELVAVCRECHRRLHPGKDL